MRVRRRGRWESRSKRGSGRILERLRELKALSLRDVRALERPEGLPTEIELGQAKRDGNRSLAIVASQRDGLDLLGWAHVALQQCEANTPVGEVMLAAPQFGARSRRAARRAATSGPVIRLVSAPALAEVPEELLVQETFPEACESAARGVDPRSVLERVLRVVEGAAAVTSCAGLRSTPTGYLLYVRGLPTLQITPEDENAVVTFLAPERRRVHVGEGNFPRWGVELHEAILQLAQDPRLLTDELMDRERAVERMASDSGCRVTGRWLPWSVDGADPVDWVGVDSSGRPVLGVVRKAPTLADAAGWIAALHVLEDERAQWVLGAEGAPRLLLLSEREHPLLRPVLSRAGLELEVVGVSPALPAESGTGSERERRGRRRPRRRRRERGDAWSRQTPAADSAAPSEPGAEEPETPAEKMPLVAGKRSQQDDSPERADEDVVEASPAAAEEAAASQALELETSAEAPEAEGPSETDEADVAAEEPEELEPSPGSEAVQLEIEATLAEEREETGGEAGEAIEPEVPRRRNSRAAIAVRDDPDSILAALILSRDRRNLVAFWVCSQERLMDFLKGRATDLPENADLLLVGFTAQPIPQEVISTVGLFRGRVQWFDHHEWPIEDVERLRDAIGRDSIVFEPGTSSPLAAVVQVTERRSRFTDKMIDLAGRRMSESDMNKWGYRLAGLLERLAGKQGEHRSEIAAVLSGKPAELPEVESVYAEEEAWIEQHDPRIVHFGEYQMAVLRVPRELDSGEVGRRGRLRTGARLSLVSREEDDVIWLGCNDEKRHINISAMIDRVSARLSWAYAVAGGDRTGRVRIEGLPEHPERVESVIGEIVKHRAILYG